MVEIGRHLREVKAELGHGEFGAWLASEFRWSERYARDLMAVSERFAGVQNGTLCRFGGSALRLLAAPSVTSEAVSEAIEMADAGKSITYTVAKELLRTSRHLIQGTFTANTEWYTPRPYIEAAKKVLGAIELDPASCDFAQQTVQAKKYHTAADDGLRFEWHGRVWLNPPFSVGLIDRFVEKLLAEIRSRRATQAILLAADNTDTSWWHDAASESAVMCVPRGRVRFYDETGELGSPTNGVTFFYFGKRVALFAKVFGKFGLIAKVD